MIAQELGAGPPSEAAADAQCTAHREQDRNAATSEIPQTAGAID